MRREIAGPDKPDFPHVLHRSHDLLNGNRGIRPLQLVQMVVIHFHLQKALACRFQYVPASLVAW
jgi:hypothetical protein